MAFAQDVALVFALLSGGVIAGCGGAPGSASDAQTASSIRSADSGRGLRADDSAQLTSASTEPVRDVRAIHKSRCGNCHVRVEPGTRTKAQLESAFTRHHTRVKMNDAEWAMMVDYLASDSVRAQASLVSAEK
ncbi:MAG: hypothetical protein ACRELY_27585 [Polyangiaceae bacterium]